MLKAHFCISRETKIRERQIKKEREREAPIIRMGTLTHTHTHTNTHTHGLSEYSLIRGVCVCVSKRTEKIHTQRGTFAGQEMVLQDLNGRVEGEGGGRFGMGGDLREAWRRKIEEPMFLTL